MRLALLFVLAAVSASAQTNIVSFTNRLDAVSNSAPGAVQTQTNQSVSMAQRVKEIRAVCIQDRRMICGKILKVLPDGLVVDSGYTNLARFPLNRSWLVPGTAVVARGTNLVEGKQPDSLCVGLVFLTDLPKMRGAKPEVYDYVNIEGFPVGQYTYTSVGDLRRTVRKFSTELAAAIKFRFEEEEKQTAAPK
jgi:hypothetical protein